MTNAVWIPGYEGRYKVCDDGTVISFLRDKVKPVKGIINPWGYLGVFLYPAGQKRMAGRRQIRIHRLVAKAFVPGYAEGLIVNHKNGIKTDNRAENLEWVTYSENTVHAIKNGLKTFNSYPVFAVHKKTGEKIAFKNVHEACAAIGTSWRSVRRAIAGSRKSCCGYLLSASPIS